MSEPRKLFYLKGDVAYTPERGCVHRVFAITEDGRDVLLAVQGFETWLDIQVPERLQEASVEDIHDTFSMLVQCLNVRLCATARARQGRDVD
jgi:hypothetical protein